MPNAEFLAPWYNERMPQSMPRWIYDTLSDHAKDTCRRIVQPVDAAHPVEAACKPAALPVLQPLRKAFFAQVKEWLRADCVAVRH